MPGASFEGCVDLALMNECPLSRFAQRYQHLAARLNSRLPHTLNPIGFLSPPVLPLAGECGEVGCTPRGTIPKRHHYLPVLYGQVPLPPFDRDTISRWKRTLNRHAFTPAPQCFTLPSTATCATKRFLWDNATSISAIEGFTPSMRGVLNAAYRVDYSSLYGSARSYSGHSATIWYNGLVVD